MTGALTEGRPARVAGAALEETPAAAVTGCRHKKINPSANSATKPPTKIHCKLSSLAGKVVRLAVGAGVLESARELTAGFCESSPAAGDPFAPESGASGGAVPEAMTAIAVLAAIGPRIRTANP